MGPCLFFLLISSKEIYHFFILYDQQGHGVMKTYCNPDNLMQLVDPEFPNLMLRTPCVMEENPIIAFVNLIETCRQFVHENAIKLYMFMRVFLETAKWIWTPFCGLQISFDRTPFNKFLDHPMP